MTIAKAQTGQQVAVASSKLPDVSRPVSLPAVLDELTPVDGFRNQQWRMRALAPAEHIATEQALVAIEARCRPATTNQIMWHIGKLLVHWDSNQSAAVKDQIMEDWKFDLAEEQACEAHIVEACATWRRTQRFKPKISEILDLIRSYKARDGERIRRARVLLQLERPRHWEKPALPKPQASVEMTPSMWLTAKLLGKTVQPPAAQEPPRRTAAEIRAELDQQRDPVTAAKLAALNRKPQEA